MRALTAFRDASTADQIWMLEHPPVYTLGLSASAKAADPVNGALDSGIPIERTERGGQITYHGPGQLVVYLMLDLRRLGLGVKELVYRVEEALIQTLASYGVDGRRRAGAPGVYVACPGGAGRFEGWAKIAALGVRVSRGCTLHGLALNVAMDLAPFEAIDPCGYPGLRAIDLASLGVACTREEVGERLAKRLAAHFASGPELR
jgi:lipoyl(octanoyl) transferase